MYERIFRGFIALRGHLLVGTLNQCSQRFEVGYGGRRPGGFYNNTTVRLTMNSVVRPGLTFSGL